jgi:hypothetical protein
MEAINHTCIGASHIAGNKVCQDYSMAINQEGLCVAVVSDGHGSERYFRSDKGAEIACKISAEKINEFVKNFNKTLIEGKPLTQCMAKSDPKNTQHDKLFPIFNQLFTSIVSSWYAQIEKHASDNPLTEQEREQIKPEYVTDFENGLKIEKVYGCTLMAVVFTPVYWFAFHIGDGKIVSLQKNPVFMEPVPWDDRCFLNRTTSLCDSNALDEFRYCYCGDGSFPDAVFLGSDGMDDSFGETQNLAEFYVKIAELIASNATEKVLDDIKDTLPNLSRKGSQDDMSLAVVFNRAKISENLDAYNNWCFQNLDAKISEKQKHTEKVEKEKQSKQTEYESVKAQKAAKENEISKLVAEYESLKKECEDAESGIEKLKLLLTAKNLKVSLLENSLSVAQSELKKIEKDLDFSEKALQVSENELNKEKTELQELINKKS